MECACSAATPFRAVSSTRLDQRSHSYAECLLTRRSTGDRRVLCLYGVSETDTTYEDPSTGAVLAQVWNRASGSDVITAVLQPVTSTNIAPSNPTVHELILLIVL